MLQNELAFWPGANLVTVHYLCVPPLRTVSGRMLIKECAEIQLPG